MERRNFLKAVGGTAVVGTTALAGCAKPQESFEVKGFGVVKQNNDAASYVTVENVSNGQSTISVYLAVYDDDGVRLSDWIWTDSDEVDPGQKRRLWVVWEMEEAGWFDSNDLGQAMQAFETRMKPDGETDNVVYSEDDVGTRIGSK